MIKTPSVYKFLSDSEYETHFSQFLLNSWSYSKLAGFSRNEKAFEMQYIFGVYGKLSASTVAGQAYHHALQYYFTSVKDNAPLTLPELETLAYEYIDEVRANNWKIQKTTPTIEDCQKKANQVTTALLNNFLGEVSVYMDEIAEVLDVEVPCNEFLTINGVDVPLPCKSKIDLIARLKNGKVAIIDHKSKAFFSNEEDLRMGIGVQAITYVCSYEAKTDILIDEVWFVENKYSQNRDKSAQLSCFKVELNKNTRKLYEALLYEPLRRMISAVNDPDYTYLINDSDNFVDKAELYDFWARTMICEVEDFNVEESKKELISKRLKKIRDSSIEIINPSIIKNFRKEASAFIQYDLSNSNMTQEQKIEHALRTFGTIVRVAHKFVGFQSQTYLLEISAGVKISSINGHKLDIANALDVANVRIGTELTVFEDKSYLAVEFAKKREEDLMFEESDLVEMRIPIGKDNYGNVIVWDLNNHSTPHVLVCGATGSGKTEFLVSTIEYCKLAGVTDIIVLDTKQDFKRKGIKGVELLCEIEEIEDKMRELVLEMQDRVESGSNAKKVIIFDEFADALANSAQGKELDLWEMQEVGQYRLSAAAMIAGVVPQPKILKVKTGVNKSLEENLRILLQKGRSLGYRIVSATQRASTKIITGDAKANFPVQVCFRVPKEVDSRVVLDEVGAEGLSGRGDGLIKSPEYNDMVRFQGYYKN